VTGEECLATVHTATAGREQQHGPPLLLLTLMKEYTRKEAVGMALLSETGPMRWRLEMSSPNR
jgi:hypothetical protein